MAYVYYHLFVYVSVLFRSKSNMSEQHMDDTAALALKTPEHQTSNIQRDAVEVLPSTHWPGPRRTWPPWPADEGRLLRKLGYSPQEVKAALRKLGLGTDTNAVLGELVRSGAKAVPSSSSDSDDGVFSLPHRGGSSSRAQGSMLEDTTEPESDLKPVVIDGSNVAMRWGHGTTGLFFLTWFFNRKRRDWKLSWSFESLLV